MGRLRLKNIQRNEKRLKDLGLDQKVAPVLKKKRLPVATPPLSPQQPTRRSTRKRKNLNYKEDQVQEHKNDDHESDTDTHARIVSDNSDFDENDDEEFQLKEDLLDEFHEIVEHMPGRKKNKRQKNTEKENVENEPSKTASSSLDGLTCELAKTGRSTCRKCRTTIEKGSPRVGMQAWIVGRQALTWQHTECFLSNLTCGYEASGRTRCKITGESFKKGELKIGARSHTATSFYKLEAFEEVLEYVLPWATSQESVRAILSVEKVDGQESLTENDRTNFQSILKSALPNVKKQIPSEVELGAKTKDNTDDKTLKKKTKVVNPEDKISTQPQVGTKIGAKGKVEWKFGGHLCYGTLMPYSETKTHCYARTRKGNTKTLAKGKDYWCMLD